MKLLQALMFDVRRAFGCCVNVGVCTFVFDSFIIRFLFYHFQMKMVPFHYHLAVVWVLAVLGRFCRDVKRPLWIHGSHCPVQLVCLGRRKSSGNTVGVGGQGLRRWPF